MVNKKDAVNAKTPPVNPEEATLRHAHMDAVISTYQGLAEELESALGMYMLGRHLGWKPLYLIHSKKTVAKYEKILGISVRESFPPETSDSDRSLAYKIAKSLPNFWKVVSGDEKLALDRDSRRSIE